MDPSFLFMQIGQRQSPKTVFTIVESDCSCTFVYTLWVRYLFLLSVKPSLCECLFDMGIIDIELQIKLEQVGYFQCTCKKKLTRLKEGFVHCRRINHRFETPFMSFKILTCASPIEWKVLDFLLFNMFLKLLDSSNYNLISIEIT